MSVSQAFWILVVNTLVHELGVPLPVLPTVLYLAARTMHSGGFLLWNAEGLYTNGVLAHQSQ